MKRRISLIPAAALIILSLAGLAFAGGGAGAEVPTGAPLASIDLATAEGVQTVKGEWRYSDTRIVEVHNMAWGDADGQTLYLCARSGLYRMRLNIPGTRP